MSPAQVAQKILPGILLLSRDTVPNIRFNAAKALGVLVAIAEPAVVTSKVRPALSLLATDSDADVSHACLLFPFLLFCPHVLPNSLPHSTYPPPPLFFPFQVRFFAKKVLA